MSRSHLLNRKLYLPMHIFVTKCQAIMIPADMLINEEYIHIRANNVCSVRLVAILAKENK